MKQPGAVPAAAGVSGFTVEFAPFVWQTAQTVALLWSVVVCVRPGERQGLGEWGAFTPWQVKQDTPAVPPAKPEPWQVWQPANPFTVALTVAPWESGLFHPAGCPTVAWQSVLLKQPGAVPAAAGVEGKTVEFAPLVWQMAQAVALPGSVLVWVLPVPRQGLGECGALTPWQVKQEGAAAPPP